MVSGDGGIGVFSLSGERLRDAPLDGAGALCAAGEDLLCAAQDGRVIWRLDRRTLVPRGLFPGGPGACDLCVSPDGACMYILCADADSVLLCDARSGQARYLNRVGCNPQQMALDGDVLAVAGGESGCVHLLGAQRLEARGCLSMPGPVYSVAMRAGAIHALCLTPALASLLVTVLPDGGRRTLALEGMPGRLLCHGDALFAATQGRLTAVRACDGRVISREDAPGRAGCLLSAQGRLYAVDLLCERLLSRAAAGGGWRVLCPARAAAIG